MKMRNSNRVPYFFYFPDLQNEEECSQREHDGNIIQMYPDECKERRLYKIKLSLR